MSLLKTKSIMKSPLVFIFIALFAFIACDTKGQKTETESSNSPKMTVHEAAFVGDLNVLKDHINAGSDLNQKDAFGSAPLSIAAVFGKPEVAKLLIDSGADLNVKSADGSTPIHSAAFFGRKEIAKMLIEGGADLTIRNNYGATALESISAPFKDLKPFYDQLSRDLGPFGLKLDYQQIEKTLPTIVEMIKAGK